jgi:polysaccharide export outer membrane protein
MNLCFYPSQQPRSLRSSRTFVPGRWLKILTFEMVCTVAVLLAAFSSIASDSAFPDFPPAAPTATGAYSAKLPASSTIPSAAITRPVKTNAVADNSAKLLAYTMTSTPVAPKPVDTNGVPNTSTNPMDVLDNEYKLAPGDTIDYQVLEDKEDPDDNGNAQSIVVTDSGDIEIPYVGRYAAAGKTCLELSRQLKDELEKKYYYQATVIISVKSMTSKGVVYVMGGVRSPGPMELPRDEVLTVSKAILRAGGFDDFADQKHVQVTRKESGTNAVFTVNVSAILDKSKVEEDRDALPGDFIYVPEKTFRY